MIELADDRVTKRYWKQLENSIEEIRGCLVKTEQNNAKLQKMPEELYDTLKAFLDLKNKRSTVYVSVDDSREGGGRYGYSGGYCIWIRPRAFGSRGKNKKGAAKPRLTAVLFHELIHAALGWELDAEFYENLFFQENHGATRPTKEDIQEMAEDNFEGWWLRLDVRGKTVHGKKEVVDLWKNDLGEFLPQVNLKEFMKKVKLLRVSKSDVPEKRVTN